jgi:soluble lytic murein transglycosylase-like protein
MKSRKWFLVGIAAASLLGVPHAFAQQAASEPVRTETQDTNIRAYVELLRSDVSAKRTFIYTNIMQLNDDQAAKFWPIYREYELELNKLNDQKIEGIKEYARTYANMTDAKADELAALALELENKRNDLKKKYHDKMRDQLGGIIAARFLQVENQILMLIDLEIASSLPIVQ